MISVELKTLSATRRCRQVIYQCTAWHRGATKHMHMRHLAGRYSILFPVLRELEERSGKREAGSALFYLSYMRTNKRP